MLKDKNSNIPIDVQNSINKLRAIINIIEQNLHRPKERILTEITIQLNITIEAARKLFSLYNHTSEGLSTYITQRKRTQTLKYIKNIDNSNLIDTKIKENSQCTRAYFDRMLYKDYKIKIKDIKSNNLSFSLTEPLDVDAIETNIKSIYEYLHKLKEEGLINIEIKRTKIKIIKK